MTSVNQEWVDKQFEQAKTPQNIQDNVRPLLTTWEFLDIPEDELEEVLTLFKDIALGHAIAAEQGPEVWRDTFRGDLVVRDIVRVKSDAFSGVAGTRHNGRVGVVIAIRNGDIIVRTTDDPEDVLDGVRYPPDLLQKLIH